MSGYVDHGWRHRLRAEGGTDPIYEEWPGGTGGGGGATQVQIWLDTPDAFGHGYSQFAGNLGWTVSNSGRHVFPAFAAGYDGSWEGVIRVPNNYGSDPEVVLSWASNQTTGNLRHQVSTFAVSNATTYDGTYVAEGYNNMAVPATANHRKDITWTLSTTPAAGDDLFVKVDRNGTSGSDTVGDDVLLVRAIFQFTAA